MDLMKGLLVERDRVQQLVLAYDGIGSAGTFGAMQLRAELRKADEAIASDDVDKIVGAYRALKNCE